jgi:hypothetical protein
METLILLVVAAVWSFQRSIIAAPVMCLFVALGLETVLLAVHSILSQRVWRLGAPARLQACWPSLRLGIVALAAVTIGAQRYAAVAHVPVHGGQSDDAIVRYWYAAGQRLPDPARVIAGLR